MPIAKAPASAKIETRARAFFMAPSRAGVMPCARALFLLGIYRDVAPPASRCGLACNTELTVARGRSCVRAGHSSCSSPEKPLLTEPCLARPIPTELLLTLDLAPARLRHRLP